MPGAIARPPDEGAGHRYRPGRSDIGWRDSCGSTAPARRAAGGHLDDDVILYYGALPMDRVMDLDASYLR